MQPTVYQPAVQADQVQAPVQPTTVQAGAGDDGAAVDVGRLGDERPTQPNGQQAVGGAGGAGADGTQVLFLGGDAWQGRAARRPGRPSANLYGYQEAQRRRKLWLIGGLSAGTAVAIAIIVVVATSLGGSPAPRPRTRPG